MKVALMSAEVLVEYRTRLIFGKNLASNSKGKVMRTNALVEIAVSVPKRK